MKSYTNIHIQDDDPIEVKYTLGDAGSWLKIGSAIAGATIFLPDKNEREWLEAIISEATALLASLPQPDEEWGQAMDKRMRAAEGQPVPVEEGGEA